MRPEAKLALAGVGWLVGFGVALAMVELGHIHQWLVGVALGALLPLGFFLAVLSWIEDK